MTCRHCVDAGDFFGSRLARHDLERYRRRGPSRTTRRLLDALLEAVARSGRPLEDDDGHGVTLLDIGGGVGALQHGFVQAGAPSVQAVDASTAYLGAAREEAQRLGEAHRYDFLAGDAVELAPRLSRARIVTLDRVLCCYPDMPGLVEVSADRAGELWGVVYPREWWGVRLGVAAINLFQRLRGKAFRVYLHGPERIRARAEERGMERIYAARTLVWQVEVYARPGGPGSVDPVGPATGGHAGI